MSLNPQNIGSGEEQHEKFRMARKTLVQYDYRHNGKLFSCVAHTLEDCRAKRDIWLKRQEP